MTEPEFELEMMFEIWNRDGDCVEIGPDRDGLGNTEIRVKVGKDIVDRVCFQDEQLPLLVQALQRVAQDKQLALLKPATPDPNYVQTTDYETLRNDNERLAREVQKHKSKIAVLLKEREVMKEKLSASLDLEAIRIQKFEEDFPEKEVKLRPLASLLQPFQMSSDVARGNARAVQEIADQHGSVQIVNESGKTIATVHGIEKEETWRNKSTSLYSKGELDGLIQSGKNAKEYFEELDRIHLDRIHGIENEENRMSEGQLKALIQSGETQRDFIGKADSDRLKAAGPYRSAEPAPDLDGKSEQELASEVLPGHRVVWLRCEEGMNQWNQIECKPDVDGARAYVNIFDYSRAKKANEILLKKIAGELLRVESNLEEGLEIVRVSQNVTVLTKYATQSLDRVNKILRDIV